MRIESKEQSFCEDTVPRRQIAPVRGQRGSGVDLGGSRQSAVERGLLYLLRLPRFGAPLCAVPNDQHNGGLVRVR